MSQAVFTESFLAVSASDIAASLRDKGFYVMQGALTDDFVETVLADAERHRFSVNRNWVSGVYADRQYYLTHMLACSESFARMATSARVFGICDQFLGARYRLKALRYYETYGKHHMQWHTDNKTDRGFAHIAGLIFIAYLVDVDDGEFQYISGSHRWSGERAYSDYADDYVQAKHAAEIVNFKGPKGTILIYDSYGIHRARPVREGDFVRKSLFFQIDANIEAAEPILLNPAYVDASDPKTMAFLGFGLPAGYGVFPETSIKSLPLGKLNVPIARWLIYRMLRFLYDSSPRKVREFIFRIYKSKFS